MLTDRLNGERSKIRIPSVATRVWIRASCRSCANGFASRSAASSPPSSSDADTSGGQLIAFVPCLDLVVARQTGSSGEWPFEAFLRRVCEAVVDTP
jgi:hypothetical protein